MPASHLIDAPANSAVLLMDLQVDFLDANGRMPVSLRDAQAVIAAANAILNGQVLRGVSPIFIVNAFPCASLSNFFRRNAAIAGSDGARIDPRLAASAGIATFAKQSSSAFTNRELEAFLRARDIQTLFVLGVFAEGCVRATVSEALRKGFKVVVVEDAIGSNLSWKRRFALWSMKRNGASSLSFNLS